MTISVYHKRYPLINMSVVNALYYDHHNIHDKDFLCHTVRKCILPCNSVYIPYRLYSYCKNQTYHHLLEFFHLIGSPFLLIPFVTYTALYFYAPAHIAHCITP